MDCFTCCANQFDAVLCWKLAYPVLFTSGAVFHIVPVVGVERVSTVAIAVVKGMALVAIQG